MQQYKQSAWCGFDSEWKIKGFGVFVVAQFQTLVCVLSHPLPCCFAYHSNSVDQSSCTYVRISFLFTLRWDAEPFRRWGLVRPVRFHRPDCPFPIKGGLFRPAFILIAHDLFRRAQRPIYRRHVRQKKNVESRKADIRTIVGLRSNMS